MVYISCIVMAKNTMVDAKIMYYWSPKDVLVCLAYILDMVQVMHCCAVICKELCIVWVKNLYCFDKEYLAKKKPSYVMAKNQ